MFKLLSNICTSLFLSILLVFSGTQVMGTNLSGGQVLGTAAGISVGYTVVSNVTGLSVSGQANLVVLKEMFTSELVDKLRHYGNWMSIFQDKSDYVGNNVIHLNQIGADPTVLIDNTSYPISGAYRTDDGITISLHKYQTTNTKVKNDELYGLTYDKQSSVTNQHRDVLAEKISKHMLWAVSPSADAAASGAFVIRTTGAADGTRLRLVRADLFRLQKLMSNALVPTDGRHIVLCPEHVEDLLKEDTQLVNQLTDQGNGKTGARIAGFNVWFSTYAVHYDNTGAKKAFEAAVAGTDRYASTVIYSPRTWKAIGDATMYFAEAESDPYNRESVVGFDQYAAGGLVRIDGSAAVVSGITP